MPTTEEAARLVTLREKFRTRIEASDDRIVAPVTTDRSTQPPINSDSPCPCGMDETFRECCEPLLKQERKAETPGELMRSRFTAHVVGDYRHLHRTYLGTAQRPYVEEADGGEVMWTRLVVHHEETGPKPNTGFVDFTAYYQEADAEQALHEKSEFTKVDGTWFYAKAVRMGPAPLKSATPKTGRNEPCPCGSGKKFKHCCGR